MNYEFILKDIRPNKEEIDSVSKTAHKILDFLNETCRKENIPAKAMFVGSFSRKKDYTWATKPAIISMEHPPNTSHHIHISQARLTA